MTDDLDAIKSDPRVLRVYGQFLKLRKAGDKYTCQCPFHADKTPSFFIHSDMMWTCFSGCGTGNIFQFLEKSGAVRDFKEAVERVKQELGVEESGWQKAKAQVESSFRPVTESKTYKTASLSAWKKMEDALAASQEAKDWLLRERGITFETAKKLRMGFARSIGNLAGKEGADVADRGWIALPCISGETITSIKYRSIAAKRFSRQPGMATSLFNTETLDMFSPVYLVVGEFDCAVLEQAGFHAVSMASDSVRLTPEQKDLLMSASCVILAGDTDASGSAALQKLWAELSERTYLLTWPDVKDANAAFKDKCGGDVEKFRNLVDELTAKAKTNPLPDVYSIQETMRNSKETTLADRADRLRFPWSNVDQMTILLPGSVLGLTSTNTSMGKTPFAIQSTLFGARKYNEVVVNWQCELSPAEISVIVAAQVLHKNRNFLSPEDLKAAADQIEGIQYYIGNNPVITDINAVLDIMEAAIRRLGATVAVLDNLHFYTTGIDDENRVQTAAIKRIKQLAGQYGVKFIVVGQPRKASAQTKGKKTHITDAKGSGSFGDTCDSFMAIHREVARRDEGEELNDIYEDKVLVEMLKTRSKGIGKSSAWLTFFGEFAEFVQIDTFHSEGSDE